MEAAEQEGTDMALQVTAIMIGVEDVARSKAFYADGLGCPIQQDHPGFVSVGLGDATSLAIYGREAAAQDAGVSPEGSGFPGISFHSIVSSKEEVDDVIGKATAAGAKIVRPAEAAQWGGYFGYFSDPDGYLWKVASAS
jgi:hypothetical protein